MTDYDAQRRARHEATDRLCRALQDAGRFAMRTPDTYPTWTVGTPAGPLQFSVGPPERERAFKNVRPVCWVYLRFRDVEAANALLNPDRRFGSVLPAPYDTTNPFSGKWNHYGTTFEQALDLTLRKLDRLDRAAAPPVSLAA